MTVRDTQKHAEPGQEDKSTPGKLPAPEKHPALVPVGVQTRPSPSHPRIRHNPHLGDGRRSAGAFSKPETIFFGGIAVIKTTETLLASAQFPGLMSSSKGLTRRGSTTTFCPAERSPKSTGTVGLAPSPHPPSPHPLEEPAFPLPFP